MDATLNMIIRENLADPLTLRHMSLSVSHTKKQSH